MTIKETILKLVEKYDWLGKEYCKLIGKNESLHKVNLEVFEEMANKVIKELDSIEELKKQNELLQMEVNDTYSSSQDIIYELNEAIQQLKINKNLAQALAINFQKENEKLKKAIEILKDKISISVNRTVVWFETEKGCVILKIDTQQEYELLKEVLGNERNSNK